MGLQSRGENCTVLLTILEIEDVIIKVLLSSFKSNSTLERQNNLMNVKTLLHPMHMKL